MQLADNLHSMVREGAVEDERNAVLLQRFAGCDLQTSIQLEPKMLVNDILRRGANRSDESEDHGERENDRLNSAERDQLPASRQCSVQSHHAPLLRTGDVARLSRRCPTCSVVAVYQLRGIAPAERSSAGRSLSAQA